MNERVLVVPRTAIEEHLKQGFFEAEGVDLMGAFASQWLFVDRPAAEQDPTHKQIIPYFAVTHEDRFLVYRRTPKQGEKRLHNKYSLGFGGHINDTDVTPDTKTNLILAALARELNEEIYLPGFRRISAVGYLNDDSNPVGQVHLGVAFVVEASNAQVGVNEKDMIIAEWLDAEGVEKIFSSLETWSQLLWASQLRPGVSVKGA